MPVRGTEFFDIRVLDGLTRNSMISLYAPALLLSCRTTIKAASSNNHWQDGLGKYNFTKEQIIGLFWLAKAEKPVKALWLLRSFSDAPFYKLQAKCEDMLVEHANQLREFEAKNAELQRLLGKDLFNNHLLKDNFFAPQVRRTTASEEDCAASLAQTPCRLLSGPSKNIPCNPHIVDAAMRQFSAEIVEIPQVWQPVCLGRIDGQLRPQFPDENHKPIDLLYSQAQLTVRNRKTVWHAASERVLPEVKDLVYELGGKDFMSVSPANKPAHQIPDRGPRLHGRAPRHSRGLRHLRAVRDAIAEASGYLQKQPVGVTNRQLAEDHLPGFRRLGAVPWRTALPHTARTPHADLLNQELRWQVPRRSLEKTLVRDVALPHGTLNQEQSTARSF